MAIRRPPTTFSDTISTADIADDAISGDKLANDIAISTTGNIATTGSGTLTVAGNTTLSGTNNLGSNPTITLGANTTYPDGAITDFVARKYAFSSNGDFGHTCPSGQSNVYRIMNRTSQASAIVPSFTAKQGYTYKIVFDFYGYTDQSSSVNSSGRRTQWKLYYGTTERSQNGTNFDTLLFNVEEGRNSASATTAQAGDYAGVTLTGAWYQSGANATTYVYFVGNATDHGKKAYIAFSATTPMYLYITEYKGNIVSTFS